MGPTFVCLCLHGEGVGSLWTQTQRHDAQGERKRTMNFSASSPLSCGEESIQSKSSKEKGGTEYPPTQSAESLPSCKGEGWGLPRLQEETNQEFKKKWHPHGSKTHQETLRCAPPQDSSPTQDIHHQPTRINLPDALSLLRTAPEAVGIGLGCLPREALRDGGSHRLWQPEGPLDFRTAVQRDLTVRRSETHPGV